VEPMLIPPIIFIAGSGADRATHQGATGRTLAGTLAHQTTITWHNRSNRSLTLHSHRSRTRMKFVTCNTVVLLGTRIRGPIGKFTRGALLFDEISTRKPQQGATSMTTRGRSRV
jgi:hypothetical protein